jgi:hypothetical protein
MTFLLDVNVLMAEKSGNEESHRELYSALMATPGTSPTAQRCLRTSAETLPANYHRWALKNGSILSMAGSTNSGRS